MKSINETSVGRLTGKARTATVVRAVAITATLLLGNATGAQADLFPCVSVAFGCSGGIFSPRYNVQVEPSASAFVINDVLQALPSGMRSNLFPLSNPVYAGAFQNLSQNLDQMIGSMNVIAGVGGAYPQFATYADSLHYQASQLFTGNCNSGLAPMLTGCSYNFVGNPFGR